MAHDQVAIMDIPIDHLSKNRLVKNVYTELERKQKNCVIVTANPEIIMQTQKTPAYKEAVLNSDYVIPDGYGIILASQILQQPLPEKIVGYELLHTFLEYASLNSKSVYFFGAQEGVAVDAAINATTLYPGLQIAGTRNGFSGTSRDVAEEIARTEPDFLFIGLGVPLQEQWAIQNRDLFPHSVLMGVGGSFDVLSGRVRRAPPFFLDRNLEWLYRLLSQPARIFRMVQLPLFVVKVYKQKWLHSKMADKLKNLP